ncbi:hypothetical protein CHUAL_011230 [Chamberlinius hualienensis]
MSHLIFVVGLISVFALSHQNQWTITDNSKACVYGWKFSENESTESINYFIGKHGYINFYCNLQVPGKLKTAYNNMTLYLSPGKQSTTVNSTKLRINSKNIGNFYIIENGTTVNCELNIKNNTGIHRFNYITVKIDGFYQNSQESTTNVTKNNSIYCINASNYDTQVCFHMLLRMINYEKSQKNVQTCRFHLFFKPDHVYVNCTLTINCYENFSDGQQPVSKTNIIFPITTLIEGTILSTIVGFRHQYFLQNYHCKCLLCHIISIIAFYFFDGVVQFFPDMKSTLCYVSFSFYYFIAMSVLSWLSIISYDSWRNISKLQTVPNCINPISCMRFKSKTRFLMYCFYAWGIPAVILTIVLLMKINYSPLSYNSLYILHIEQIGFFDTKLYYGIFWCLPIGFYTALICIFMILTICDMRQAAIGTNVVNQQIHMQIFLMSTRIVVVLGFNWIISFILNILPLFNWELSGITLNVSFYCGILQGYFLAFIYIPKHKIWDKIRHGIASFRRFRVEQSAK